MQFFYKDMKFEISKEVYKPAEDTFLLADNLEVSKDEKVLEIGTGSGLISILCAKRGASVVATDINPHALDCARNNAEKHGVLQSIDFRTGSMFDSIRDEEFDLIIFNPPYLPVSEGESYGEIIEKAWDGGPDGRKFIDKFLTDVDRYLKEDGRFYLVQSSLSDIGKTLSEIHNKEWRVIEEVKNSFFEKIYLLKVFRN